MYVNLHYGRLLRDANWSRLYGKSYISTITDIDDIGDRGAIKAIRTKYERRNAIF